MENYKIINEFCIQRQSDLAFIPLVDGNRDFSTYQEWLKEGNVPIPADPEPIVVPQKTVDERLAALEEKTKNL